MRILVIENEHKVARAVERALEQENYTVDTVYDGDSGCSKAIDESYDLVIIDRSITGQYDGTGIVKAMRDAKIHTPVLLLAEPGTTAEKAKGLSSGADDYLIKPFALTELLARIRELLHQPSKKAGKLVADDLVLDTTTFTVTRGDTILSLTSKEFALLEYLLRNQDRPSSKEMIISYVWNYNTDVLLNTVEVYIKYLRAKVDDPFKKKLIKTIRGFGYKIEA